MYFTTVHIERPEGTIVARNLIGFIESADGAPARDEAQERDYLTVHLYLPSIPLSGLQRRDVVQDDLTTDPLTGQPVRLRVVAVEVFERDHIEAICQQLVGD